MDIATSVSGAWTCSFDTPLPCNFVIAYLSSIHELPNCSSTDSGGTMHRAVGRCYLREKMRGCKRVNRVGFEPTMLTHSKILSDKVYRLESSPLNQAWVSILFESRTGGGASGYKEVIFFRRFSALLHLKPPRTPLSPMHSTALQRLRSY